MPSSAGRGYNRAMIKLTFAVVLALAAASARASSDDSFGVAIRKINEAAAKTAAAQAKRAQAAKAAEKAPMCTQAQADSAYADLARCEASMKKEFGSVRDAQGALHKGFTRETSLVLLTTTDAFFYHEDCDICAAVERCSLKDGKVSNFKSAHGVGCDDLAPFLKKDVVYSSCALKP